MNIFEHIYRNDLWHGGSGPGSLPSVNRPYVRLLQSFLRSNHIETVVDLGCGDWQFSRRINWGKARYLGLDVVPHVLESNRRRFGRAAVEFAVSPEDPDDIPGADLLNADIPDGGFRPVDLRLPPFALPMASVLQFGSRRIFNPWRFEFTTPGVKEVFLWIRPAVVAAPPKLEERTVAVASGGD
jgi:SAM-dependent methyltransferase